MPVEEVKKKLPIHPWEAAAAGYTDKTVLPGTTGIPATAPGTDYRTMAQSQYDPSYNRRVAAMNALMGNNVQALEGQRAGIEQNYANIIDNQNINNAKLVNNYDNMNLGRGLGRSTVNTSGVAGINDQNNRTIKNINYDKAGALGSLDAQISTMKNGINAQLSQMEIDREDEITALMQQLETKASDDAWRQKEWDYNVGQDKINNGLKANADTRDAADQTFNQDLKTKQYQLDVKNSNKPKSTPAADPNKPKSLSTAEADTRVSAEFKGIMGNMTPDQALAFVQRNASSYLDAKGENYIGSTGYNKLIALIKANITKAKSTGFKLAPPDTNK